MPVHHTVASMFFVLPMVCLMALGKPESKGETETFHKIDLNQDKVITKEEMLHYLLALDTFPDDEKILKEHEELVDEIIKGTDTDKDGFLTMDEFFQYGLGEEEKKHMMEMDTNGDEKISRDELFKYLLKHSEHSEEGSGKNKNKIIDDMFSSQDIDNDGVLNYEEFDAEHDEL